MPPHHSSQECAAGGFTHPDSRPGQAEFICQRCGNRDHSDFNAGKVIAKRGIHLVLSDDVAVQEKKRCAIKRNKVGAGSSEPAAMPPTLVETSVRRLNLSVLAQQSVKQETLLLAEGFSSGSVHCLVPAVIGRQLSLLAGSF